MEIAVEEEVNLVTLEGIGSVESALAAECAPSRMAVVVVNQRQVRDFARSLVRLAKTDVIDAAVRARQDYW